MSIEDALNRLAAAYEANTAALLGGVVAPTEVKKPAGKKEPAATAPAASQTTATAQKGSPVQEKKADDSAAAPVYKDLQTVLYELCNKKGVEHGQKFVASLGYKKMSDAKPEDFADLIAKFRTEIDA